MWAIAEGHTEIVKLLIERNAHVDHANINGDTALTLAAHRDRIEIVQLLFEHGANVNQTNINGDSALTLASEKGLMGIV